MQNDRKCNRAFPTLTPNTPSSFNQDFLKKLELKDAWTGGMHFYLLCFSFISYSALYSPGTQKVFAWWINGCIYGEMNEMCTWNGKEPRPCPLIGYKQGQFFQKCSWSSHEPPCPPLCGLLCSPSTNSFSAAGFTNVATSCFQDYPHPDCLGDRQCVKNLCLPP